MQDNGQSVEEAARDWALPVAAIEEAPIIASAFVISLWQTPPTS
jgi:hypothetical protein